MSDVSLLATTDASVWAKEFVRLHGGDEGLMIAWFANMWAATHDPLQEQLDALERQVKNARGAVVIAKEWIAERDAEIEPLKVEAKCNYCGKYHGKEVCEDLLSRIEKLEVVVDAAKELAKGMRAQGATKGRRYIELQQALDNLEADDE